MIKNKIKSRQELIKITSECRKAGLKVGFTSGAFDLFHAGHADYLEKAKAVCDVLIAGVNTDESVKKYKGENRPFVAEKQRIKVLAALEALDYVFFFSERRNQKNIEMLKPDFYIKAGDYSPEALTSKNEVEKHGGRVVLIPIEENVSSTQIITKIRNFDGSTPDHWVEKGAAVHKELKPAKTSPAVFIDRDGTVNEEVSYLHEPEKFRLLPQAVEGIRQFQDMGYRIIIITNQPGIGMGYFSKEDFYKVNREMLRAFSAAGILVDKVYFCPHSKSEKCECRKPGQALIERAREELNLDLTRSIFIGDKTSDIETGLRAGMNTVLVTTGYGGKDGEYDAVSDVSSNSLKEAADYFLKKERNSGEEV